MLKIFALISFLALVLTCALIIMAWRRNKSGAEQVLTESEMIGLIGSFFLWVMTNLLQSVIILGGPF